MTTTTTKTMRADARANREKILQTALNVFTTQGPEASLNEVARQAGIGVGTLYRHFPTRDDLVIEVYSAELAALGAATDELLAALPPGEALDAWGARFLEYAATKRGLGQALKAIRERGDMKVDAGAVLRDSLGKLLAAGREAGTISGDADPEDVFLALSGLWSMPHDEHFKARANRLLALVLAGLRNG